MSPLRAAEGRCERSAPKTFALVRWSVLLALLPMAHAASPMLTTSTVPTMSTNPDYGYEVMVESYASRLQYLAQFDLGRDGYFEILLDLMLTIAVPQADKDRVMLHLLACDEEAVYSFLSTDPSEPITGMNLNYAPSYCAIQNRTLAYYCRSFPLEDESPDVFVYRSFKKISASIKGDATESGFVKLNAETMPMSGATTDGTGGRNGTTTTSQSTLMYFFIDACETVGGRDGILRSCLESPPGFIEPAAGSTNSQKCFYCPKNYPASISGDIAAAAKAEKCVISPPLPPTLHGVAFMNLCTANGECLGNVSDNLTAFYGVSTLMWGISCVVWLVHIRTAARDAVVELQNKMKLVPLTQLLYSALMFVSLTTKGTLVGTMRDFVQNAAIVAQFIALAVSVEVVVLVAKGWKITRQALPARELQWIRFVTLIWALSFVVLKYSEEKHLTVVLVWGISWACVVFMIWYNSAFNINMLKYQIALVRDLQLDPQRTPVYTKFMLFRRFRALLATYIFLSCIFGVVGLVNDATQRTWQWSSVMADEGLTYLLYVALGYTFRCRRFSSLMPGNQNGERDTSTTTNQPEAATNVHRSSIAPEPITVTPEQLPKRKKTAMIVVLNPDHDQQLGTAFGPDETTGDLVKKSAPNDS